jgi:hypothetical protein
LGPDRIPLSDLWLVEVVGRSFWKRIACERLQSEPIGPCSVRRFGHSLIPLHDETGVLLAGGFEEARGKACKGVLKGTLVNEERVIWEVFGSLDTPRGHHAVALLPDFSVALIGGTALDGSDDAAVRTISILDSLDGVSAGRSLRCRSVPVEPPFPFPVLSPAVAVHGPEIFVLTGGTPHDSDVSSTIGAELFGVVFVGESAVLKKYDCLGSRIHRTRGLSMHVCSDFLYVVGDGDEQGKGAHLHRMILPF